MAFSNTAAAAEYVHRGAVGVKGTYTTKRKYSLSDLIVWQERKWNKFDNILRTEGQTITVDDPEPKILTKQEAPIKFDLHSDGTTTTLDEDTARISDTEAKFLQAGDVLICNEVFCDSDGAAFSTDKFDATDEYTPEMVIVSSVTLGGAASGIANVVLKRGNGACPTSSVTTLLTEYKLVKNGNALEDGGDAPTAIYHEPNQVQNYCQFFSKTWQETETQSNMNVFGKETMADKGKRKRLEFFREVENALMFGRKYKDTYNGQSRWFTGGIVEYIATATTALDSTTRYLDFSGAFDLETWREKMEIVFRYGGESKVAFCGGKFFTVLYNNLEKFIRANDTLSKKWGFEVYTLETGHGLLHLMRHPLFTEYDTSNEAYAYDCLIVDPAYVWVMIHKGMDVKVKANVQDRDEHTKKNEIYSQLGLRRTHPTAHAYIHGITG